MTSEENSRILLLGATGYTGGLVLAALLRRGARPVLAGRNAAALAALAVTAASTTWWWTRPGPLPCDDT
ncbi:hypothetical protein [Streptomyces sp. NPDC001091]